MAITTAALTQTGRADDAMPPLQTNQVVQATSVTSTNQLDGDLFRANEMSVDIFGTLSYGQKVIDNPSLKRVNNNGHGGVGVGLNYFFTRILGVGADAYSENTRSTFVDNVSGNLILRLPIEAIHLAPYIYGGGGYQFEHIQRSFAQFGGGLDFRFTKSIGLFVDGRYVMTDGIPNFGLARAGVRFAF